MASSARRARSGGKQPHHIQAVIKVRAKTAFADCLVQRTIGRRNDPHIDRDFRVGADRAQRAALQHVQKFRLKGQRQIVHVVEEQRPTVGGLEKPFTMRDGARKRPLAGVRKVRSPPELR